TDLRMAMTAAIRKVFVENPKEFDPRKYLGPGRDAIEEIVSHKIKNVFRSSGSASK
ncbi:MAG: class II fructose-bisphosphate aldolase, partial [Filifactoraceae bacterium]